MKKLFNIFLLCLLTLTSTAQSPKTHRLSVETLPEGVVSVTVNFFADIVDDGGVTSSTQFYYCTDTLNNVQVPVGAPVEFYISYRSYDFALKEWTLNGLPYTFENQTPKASYLSFTMPDEDVKLRGFFEYDPEAPGYQPGANSWDPETGTLILDYDNRYPAGFTEDDYDKVLRFISQSFGNIYDFKNCLVYDLSRSTIETIKGGNYGGPMSELSIKEVGCPI